MCIACAGLKATDIVGFQLRQIKVFDSRSRTAGKSPWLAGLDIDDFNGSVPQAVKAAGGRHWAPHYKSLTMTRLEEAHRLGLKVFVWTVDSRSEMMRLLEMGVDGIITNRPDVLKTVLELAR